MSVNWEIIIGNSSDPRTEPFSKQGDNAGESDQFPSASHEAVGNHSPEDQVNSELKLSPTPLLESSQPDETAEPRPLETPVFIEGRLDEPSKLGSTLFSD
jgi:hypothetical protein